MSTTIHVTIQDHAEALAVVATLLNQRYEVSIDMDRVDLVEPDYMSRERVEIHEKLWGDAKRAKAAEASKRRAKGFIDARGERCSPIIHAGAAVHFDGNDYFIDGRKVSMAEFDREMKMRMQARDERSAEAALARAEVECTSCGSTVGEFCISSSGKRYTDFVHVDRIRALHTSHEAVPARD